MLNACANRFGFLKKRQVEIGAGFPVVCLLFASAQNGYFREPLNGNRSRLPKIALPNLLFDPSRRPS